MACRASAMPSVTLNSALALWLPPVFFFSCSPFVWRAQVVCPEFPSIFPVKACLAVQTARVQQGKGKYPEVWFWLHVWPRRFQEGAVINFTLTPSFDKSSGINRENQWPFHWSPTCSLALRKLSHKLLSWRNGLARRLGLCLGIKIQSQDGISVC